MSKFKQPEPTEQWKPTLRDTAVMREALTKYEVKVINGKKRYPFEQYCASKGWISFQDNGQLAVTSPESWRQACAIYDLMKWENGKEMDKMFTAYPETQFDYEQKIEAVKNEIRALFGKMKVA